MDDSQVKELFAALHELTKPKTVWVWLSEKKWYDGESTDGNFNVREIPRIGEVITMNLYTKEGKLQHYNSPFEVKLVIHDFPDFEDFAEYGVNIALVLEPVKSRLKDWSLQI